MYYYVVQSPTEKIQPTIPLGGLRAPHWAASTAHACHRALEDFKDFMRDYYPSKIFSIAREAKEFLSTGDTAGAIVHHYLLSYRFARKVVIYDNNGDVIDAKSLSDAARSIKSPLYEAAEKIYRERQSQIEILLQGPQEGQQPVYCVIIGDAKQIIQASVPYEALSIMLHKQTYAMHRSAHVYRPGEHKVYEIITDIRE